MLKQEKSIHIYGLTNSSSGLGVNLRMTGSIFREMGYQTELFNTDTTSSVNDRRNMSGAEYRMFHVNADKIPRLFLENPEMGLYGNNIGFLLWEFQIIPRQHQLGIDLLDQIWVPTNFVKEAYQSYTKTPIRVVGKSMDIPVFHQVYKASKSISSDKEFFEFLISFDFHSSVERKNPLAAVRAFKKAFATNDRTVRLTVKTTEYVPGYWGDPNDQWSRILYESMNDDRIRIIIGNYDSIEFLSLISNADCVLSTHRSEGFGYLPAYAMLLGVPVIVTDYSGTKDFCSEYNSYPIQYEMVDVREGEFIFPIPGAQWASISEDALVEAMRRVILGKEEREEVVKRAIMYSYEQFSTESMISRYQDALGLH